MKLRQSSTKQDVLAETLSGPASLVLKLEIEKTFGVGDVGIQYGRAVALLALKVK